jgi:outer membrane immunogenic protein
MKRISSWGLALAAVLVAGAAQAVDILSAAPAYPSAFSPVPYYNWTGLYVGVNGGYGLGNPNWYDGPDGIGGAYDARSGLVGGTIGYNAMTLAPFVFGEETDLDVSRFRTFVAPPSCGPGCEFKSDWVGTARLRFGVEVGNFLPYVTAGLSFAQLSAGIVGGPFGTAQSKINMSWVVGAGVEYLLWDRWSAKIEYLYIDSSGITCDTACGTASFPSPQGTTTFKLNESVVRLGLNYRLWNFY